MLSEVNITDLDPCGWGGVINPLGLFTVSIVFNQNSGVILSLSFRGPCSRDSLCDVFFTVGEVDYTLTVCSISDVIPGSSVVFQPVIGVIQIDVANFRGQRWGCQFKTTSSVKHRSRPGRRPKGWSICDITPMDINSTGFI